MKRATTSTFLLELPLRLDPGQANRLRAHLEVARCFYNALLGEALARMRRMRRDPAWQAARALPRSHKQERSEAFARLRTQYGFSDFALHDFAKGARSTWISDHIDSTMAQTLATRAYRAVNRVCLGQSKKVRFKSKGRGFDSVEGKRNNTGVRFVHQAPEEGNAGWLIWGGDRIPAVIDRHDPVVQHGLRHPIKYVRLLRRKASGPRARGADSEGNRYFVQLILVGKPYLKPKNQPGNDTLGLDIGPSTLAIFARHGTVRLQTFCEELHPDLNKKRRLERKMERQRRANNAHNYDERGRVKVHGTHGLRLKRTVAKTGGILDEVSTSQTKLSQYCHGCRRYVKKPLSQRWHHCACGIGPVQRDLYSAFLLAYLEPPETIPSIAHDEWEGADLRLAAAVEVLKQRAKEGQSLPRSFGIPGARARRPENLAPFRQELISLYRRGRLEALEREQDPPRL